MSRSITRFFTLVLALGVLGACGRLESTRPKTLATLQADFTVNSTQDAVDTNPGDGVCATEAGECTLRAAIMEANALAGAQRVHLPAGDYLLTLERDFNEEESEVLGSLLVTGSLTLIGEGAERTIIQAGLLDPSDPERFISNNVDSVLVIRGDGATQINIEGVTLRDGYFESFGFINEGATTTFTNSAIIANPGGGIQNEASGALTLERTIVSGNGGAFRFSGSPDFSGILNRGQLTIRNSEVTSNGGSRGGAGILNAEGELLLEDSLVANNAGSFSGGIANGSTATIRRSIIRNNSGRFGVGGIGNGGTLVLEASTLADNTTGSLEEVEANAVGGLSNAGTADIINSTISGNKGISIGGIYNDGTLNLVNVTLAENVGGFFSYFVDAYIPGVSGIANQGSATLVNTIVAVGRKPVGDGDIDVACGGAVAVTSQGHNLDDDGTCRFTQTTDLADTNPLLGELEDNGGPTFTHALLAGSPTIDAGSDTGLETDQRGISRPQGRAFDIGAFELEQTPPPTDTTAPTCTVEVNNTQQAIVRVQDSGSGLASIRATRAVNAAVTVPNFNQGATLVRITISKRRLNLPGVVRLEASDAAGNRTRCAPVILRR